MPSKDRYEELYNNFRWHVPETFNIGWECCTKWAGDNKRVALILEEDNGRVTRYTYAQLQADANRLSNALAARGVVRGDRVAIMLPQGPQTIVAHVACYQMGAVAMPMSVLFGPDALEYRLIDSAAVAALVDGASFANLAPVLARCAALASVIAVEPVADATAVLDYRTLLDAASASFAAVTTRAEDPALLIYTSGTTGPPKGALKPHRVLIGNLPGFVASQNWFPQQGDVFWSPADWAWTGGLMDALLPTLYFGHPIVASMARGTGGRFDAERAYALMERHQVTNAFLFPTALKMMMKALEHPRQRYRLKLRAIMSAGEAVGDAVFHWCERALGVTVNEMFGQTEINYIVGNCGRYIDVQGQAHAAWPARPGSSRRPPPS